MRKILFASVLILAGASSFSQIKYGVKAGLNISNVAQNFADPSDEFKTKLKPGFQLGVVVNYELTESFSLISGLSYINKGASEDLEDGLQAGVTAEGYSRLALGYLEVPLNFVYKINNFNIMAGPYVALGINGKEKWDYTFKLNGQVISESADEFSDYKFKNTLGDTEMADNSAYLKAIDAGLNFGVGYNINGMVIDLNYSLGLTNMNPKIEATGITDDSSDFKVMNRVVSIGATYFFGN